VKVLCKDATKIEGSTLLYINRKGHLFQWCSEKLENLKKQHPQDPKDRDDLEDEDEEEKEEDSSDNHDSGFTRLWRE
jgi:hypothetical protein